ncbi:MAG: acyl-CoA thioesterase [Bacillales bacterium]|jgi:acyl-CoA hydrolase|nr:acyl-CoA thioesterase [Bacillales bacterium]
MESKHCIESLTIKTSRVFPNDINNHSTLFGGSLMSWIDDIASISAARHSRKPCVTASIDSIHFIQPITQKDSVCLESYVTWAGNTSMEVFVKVIAENLLSGERKIAATSFLTFVAFDVNGKPARVPKVIPESSEEKYLHETASVRAEHRKERRQQSKELADYLKVEKPW